MRQVGFQQQVAQATGESLATVRGRGFNILTLDVQVRPAESLCLSCPGCGRQITIPNREEDGHDWAECEMCDIAYPYADEELFLPDDELVIAT